MTLSSLLKKKQKKKQKNKEVKLEEASQTAQIRLISQKQGLIKSWDDSAWFPLAFVL